LTVEVPAPEEPVIESIGCFLDIGYFLNNPRFTNKGKWPLPRATPEI
jgi:hypothetical protein